MDMTDKGTANPLTLDRNPLFKQFKRRLMQRDAAVRAHEAAHQSAAGSLGGGIRLETNTQTFTGADGQSQSVTYVDGGSVNITMPGLPSGPPSTEAEKKEVSSLLAQYKQVEAAAVAPASLGGEAGELSGADISIAAMAQSKQGQLQSWLNTDTTKVQPDFLKVDQQA